MEWIRIVDILGAPEITANLYCNLAYLYWEGCLICSIYICGNLWVTQYHSPFMPLHHRIAGKEGQCQYHLHSSMIYSPLSRLVDDSASIIQKRVYTSQMGNFFYTEKRVYLPDRKLLLYRKERIIPRWETCIIKKRVYTSQMR